MMSSSSRRITSACSSSRERDELSWDAACAVMAPSHHAVPIIVNNAGHFATAATRPTPELSSIDNNSADSFIGRPKQKEKEMTDGLRKGLASYGDAGFSLFLRKAFIKAMGYSNDALDRPIVGITNT